MLDLFQHCTILRSFLYLGVVLTTAGHICRFMCFCCEAMNRAVHIRVFYPFICLYLQKFRNKAVFLSRFMSPDTVKFVHREHRFSTCSQAFDTQDMDRSRCAFQLKTWKNRIGPLQMWQPDIVSNRLPGCRVFPFQMLCLALFRWEWEMNPMVRLERLQMLIIHVPQETRDFYPFVTSRETVVNWYTVD